MEAQASQGQLEAEGDCGMLNLLVPSPQSEAVTQDMEELSLQPTLPPLSERKNGEKMLLQGDHGFSETTLSVSCRSAGQLSTRAVVRITNLKYMFSLFLNLTNFISFQLILQFFMVIFRLIVLKKKLFFYCIGAQNNMLLGFLTT